VRPRQGAKDERAHRLDWLVLLLGVDLLTLALGVRLDLELGLGLALALALDLLLLLAPLGVEPLGLVLDLVDGLPPAVPLLDRSELLVPHWLPPVEVLARLPRVAAESEAAMGQRD